MYRAILLVGLGLLASATPGTAAECTAVPACAYPVIGEALRGDTVVFDGSGTEGAPSVLEWYVTEPGDAVPVTPAATGVTTDVVVTTSGRWSIGLRARYLHQAPGGGLYCDQTCVAVEVRSVDAVLADPGAEVDLDDDLPLDGSASRWGAAVAPQMTWRIDGTTWSPCGGWPTSPSQVACTIAAADLGLGPHTVELELRDPSNGDVDTDSVTVEVIDPPPQTADFTWSPTHPGTSQIVAFEALTDPLLLPTGMVSVSWTWGDGTSESWTCPGIWVACTITSHVFDAERRFPVVMTLRTSEGDALTVVHGVEIGDAQIFSDGFESGLSPSWSSGP